MSELSDTQELLDAVNAAILGITNSRTADFSKEGAQFSHLPLRELLMLRKTFRREVNALSNVGGSILHADFGEPGDSV